MSQLTLAVVCVLALLSASGSADEPVYRLLGECGGIHPQAVLSWKECERAVSQHIQLAGRYPEASSSLLQPKLSPSAVLGRKFPRGCYFFTRRVQEKQHAVFWNERDGTHLGPFQSSASVRVVCKHGAVHRELHPLVTDLRKLKERVPLSKVARSADVSHIVAESYGASVQAARDVAEQGVSWADAVGKYTISPTRDTGGRLGVIFEGTLDAGIDAAVFQGRAPYVKEGVEGAARLVAGVKSSLGYHAVLVHTLDDAVPEGKLERELLEEDVVLNGMYIEYGVSRPARLRELGDNHHDEL